MVEKIPKMNYKLNKKMVKWLKRKEKGDYMELLQYVKEKVCFGVLFVLDLEQTLGKHSLEKKNSRFKSPPLIFLN